MSKLGIKRWSTIAHSEDAFWEHKLMSYVIQPAHLTVELRSAKMAHVKTALQTATEVSQSYTLYHAPADCAQSLGSIVAAAIAVDVDVENVENVADEATVGGFNALTVMIAPTKLASGMCCDALSLNYS
jgi:hypothetical protein